MHQSLSPTINILLSQLEKKINTLGIKNFKSVSQFITDKNFIIFENLCIGAIATKQLTDMFQTNTKLNSNSIELLKNTTGKNKAALEYYTKLGGTETEILKKNEELLVGTLFDLDTSKLEIRDLNKIIHHLSNDNVELIKKIINNTDLKGYELRALLDYIENYTEPEIENTITNIDNGNANYFSEIINSPKHLLRRTMNSSDFKNKNLEFDAFFNRLMYDKIDFFELLKFPLPSPDGINKLFRDTAKVAEVVYNNTTKAFDEFEAQEEFRRFFGNNFPDILGMIAFSDKETVLHIFDKGFLNAEHFIKNQKNLTKKDYEILKEIIQNGKRINSHNEIIDISAQKKLYALNTININRNLLANTVGEIDFLKALNKTTKGTFIDFENIESQIITKVLKNFGFTEKELLELKKENLDWDKRFAHLLLIPQKSQKELKIVVQQATQGTFKEFLNSTDNIYGQSNKETEALFKQANLNFKLWKTGIPPESFKFLDENFKISISSKTPQTAIFGSTYTTCCTSLDGTNGDSMAKYLLSDVFNIVNIENSQGEIIAQSRFYMINPRRPALLIDNVEVNNNFKKKLYCNRLKDTFLEKIFSYQRDFIKNLSKEEKIPLYFSFENNKLYNNDTIQGYPIEL